MLNSNMIDLFEVQNFIESNSQDYYKYYTYVKEIAKYNHKLTKVQVDNISNETFCTCKAATYKAKLIEFFNEIIK